METVKKPLALVLGVVAIGVLLHFVFNPFYEDLVDVVSIWNVINWFMAFAVIVTVAATYVHKKGVRDDTYMRLWFNLTFHAAAVLAILFFWNWFDDLTVGRGWAEPDAPDFLGVYRHVVRRTHGHGERPPMERPLKRLSKPTWLFPPPLFPYLVLSFRAERGI